MIKSSGFYCFLFLIVHFSSFATLSLTVNQKCLMKCTFSSTHQNRILAENDKIYKVIHPNEDQVSVEIEEKIGQAFVLCAVDQPPTTTFSIITARGLIQDIEVDFVDMSSETLVLLEPHLMEECIQPCNDIFSESISEKVKMILSGYVPNGFKSLGNDGSVRMIKKCLKAKLISKLSGFAEDIYVWRIRNTARIAQCVMEYELEFKNSLWVFMERNDIGPGQTVTAIVAVKS